jgi:NAD+ synthase (glutamine-hydrolysing)
MKIGLCQLNTIMGDIAGNTIKVREALESVKNDPPDLLVFSELFLQGYFPRDLLEQPWFINETLKAVETVCGFSRRFPHTALCLGCALPNTRGRGKRLSNAAIIIDNGSVVFRQDKSLLPTYDVFDEGRYFDPADAINVFPFRGETLGISICEDAWNDPELWPEAPYSLDPISILAEKGATLLVNISGSPFHMGKEHLRFSMMQRHAKKHALPVIYVNQIGGNDELIFDGNSMVIDKTGELCVSLPGFKEDVRVIETRSLQKTNAPMDFDSIQCLYEALCLGIRDYMYKCHFSKAVVGLSGGIDSAVTCALAAFALGAENVTGITMPSRYSSPGSIEDSLQLAHNLGIRFETTPIEPIFASYLATLQSHWNGKKPDITEENIQARIRGSILMALSNKFGCLLLSTGNKSEMAVGYCTLYGDMSGGLSVISDLPKTMVYALADFINRDKKIIPVSSITKAPSAELRPNQTDQDSLPPYDVLDKILELLIEKGRSIREIVAEGFDEKTVSWIVNAVRKAEYKRRQAAPGLKVSPKAFGVGRRFPLAAEYSC